LNKTFIIIVKSLIAIILALLSCILIYILSAVLCSSIPVHRSSQKTESDTIGMYILSNGVHLDLIFPLKNAQKDWSAQIDPDVQLKEQSKFIGFGWGDKNFYLHTPEWKDLTFRTTYKALFMKGPAAIHVTFYKGLHESKDCLLVHLNLEEYKKIVHYIEGSFKPDKNGNPQLIMNFQYEKWDKFYEARGSYSPFFTCNSWVNRALRKSGLRACLWTPFDKGIFWQYNRIANPSLP
jgi:uncharacterized protein (TIGR02117 family)